MKTGERLHGFFVESSEYINEISATLYTLRHEKHGTPLVFLDRDDSNKSFYIAFKTLPEDDTGVFHIIEHSVLCGSRKFPVKEPFVELLKSSLKTFLNAMTYPDRTVYPVSSRCDKDFLNLIDVYMDAVFHPLMLENEFVFMQEGHRYELSDKDAPLTLNGVVYNEMKGSASSPDELSGDELLKLLYSGTVYAKNSGGDPDAIPSLSYEDFRASHAKYYHPSNAYVFLDGRVDLGSVLPLIDSYLSEYSVRDGKIDVGDDCPTVYTEKTVEYELSREESPEGKARAYLGVRSADFDDVERSFELSVLTDAIAGSNEAPLKKALLSSGIVEDVSVFPLGDGIKFGSYVIELKNLAEERIDEAFALLDSTLRELASTGIGRDLVEASLNMREFRLREKDFGSLPRGLVYGLAALDAWIYGASPKLGLAYESVLDTARRDLGTDRYERLLAETFINNERKVKLTLLPSCTLGERREKEELVRLEGIKSSMTADELDAIISKGKAFDAWQKAPDSSEDLDMLPTLSISDIPSDTEWTPTDERVIGGKTVLVHDVPTDGISYAELYFDISDLDEEELSLASLLASLLGKCATSRYTADELARLRKAKLGSFYVQPTSFKRNGAVTPYLQVFASALDKNRGWICELVGEIVNATSFDDVSAVKNVIKQRIISMREGFISSGHSAAVRRASAYTSSGGAVAECFFGIEMYKRLVRIDREFEKDPSALSNRLTALFRKCFTRARLTPAITGTPDDSFSEALATLPKAHGEPHAPRTVAPLGKRNEGIIIPSRVSYIGAAASLDDLGEEFTGSMHVISNILSYTHLWNSIRVRGGAYGAGFIARQSGGVSVHSYRDPNPAASIAAAAKCSEFLAELAESGESLDSYIIGTFGDYDSLSSARAKGTEASGLWLAGKTHADEKRVRESMLAFDKTELLRLSKVTKKISDAFAVCVFGPKEQLEPCRGTLSEIMEIM